MICGDVKLNSKQRKVGSEDEGKHKSTGNRPDLSSRPRKKLRKIFGRRLGGHQEFLINEVRRGRLVGHERQFEVVDDPVHHGEIREESDDLHRPTALRADERVNFINLPDHYGPAPAGYPRAFFLDDQELRSLAPPTGLPGDVPFEAQVGLLRSSSRPPCSRPTGEANTNNGGVRGGEARPGLADFPAAQTLRALGKPDSGCRGSC